MKASISPVLHIRRRSICLARPTSLATNTTCTRSKRSEERCQKLPFRPFNRLCHFSTGHQSYRSTSPSPRFRKNCWVPPYRGGPGTSRPPGHCGGACRFPLYTDASLAHTLEITARKPYHLRNIFWVFQLPSATTGEYLPGSWEVWTLESRNPICRSCQMSAILIGTSVVSRERDVEDRLMRGSSQHPRALP